MIDIKKLMYENNTKALSYTIVNGYVAEDTKLHGVDKIITDDTIFSACSISKLLTTIAVLQAKDENILDLSEDINKYLDGWKLEGALVTVEDLLINQSGIDDCDESYGTYDPSKGRANLIDLLDGRTSYIKERVTVKEEPRKTFIYSDNNFLILEKLLEDLYQMKYRDLVYEKILKPLGMNSSRYVDFNDLDTLNYANGTDKNGNYINKEKNIYPYDSIAGLWTTSNDLSKLMIELLKSLSNKSHLILRPETTKAMMTGKGCVDFMGYGVFVYNLRGKKVFYSQGWGEGFQSYMLGFLDDGDGIVVMMNQNPEVEQMEGPIGEIVKDYINRKFES